MILKAFCLFDTKTGMFNVPWFQAHIGMAVRTVADLAGDVSTLVGRHPADFCLMELGSWDDQSGAFSSILPINHGAAVSFLEAKTRSQPGFGFAEPVKE